MKHLAVLLLVLAAADGVWLTWALPPYGTPTCPTPIHLYFREAYLGPGTGLPYFDQGVRLFPPTQTSLFYAKYGTPIEVGCALMWDGDDPPVVNDGWPVARGSDWRALPPPCQPYNRQADGIAWEGM